MSTLDKHEEGCTIISPDKKIQWKTVIVGCVDDKRQYANDWHNNSLLTVSNNLKSAIQSWEHLLHTSSGKLELTKCACYCISWQFNPEGTPQMSNDISHKILLIDSATQQLHTIKQLPINWPFKYLGTESTLLGTTGHQFASSKKQALRGARIISSSNMNRHHVTLYLKTHLHPKLMSPLACTFLTSKQYIAIKNLYISPALSAMGHNHTWPIALRYGDYKYYGLQLRNLDSETLIRKIQQLQLLLMKPDTSKLILIMLACYQHVSGLGSSILEQHQHKVNYINSCWLNDFVRLLKKYDVEIKLRTTYIQPLQRENNSFLMDRILTNYSSLTTIKKLHACRLYLQVTLLSDITNLKGDKLLPNSINGIREPHRHSAYAWPRQQRPNEHSWKLWKTMLQQLYSSPTSQFIRSPLRLRRWNNCSTVLHRYLYSTLEQEIYQRDHSKITQ